MKKRKISFLRHPILYTQSYYKSELGKISIKTQEDALEKASLKIKMNAISRFYETQFETFCKMKDLDPIEQLQIRMIELKNEGAKSPLPVIINIMIGCVGSLSIHYLITLQNADDVFLNLVYMILGFCIMFYGSILVYHRIYESETFYPKFIIIQQHELEVISKLLDSYLDELKRY